ncbi:MAG: DUF1329 domain-containing protein [Candidatus Binataceae bacterium]
MSRHACAMLMIFAAVLLLAGATASFASENTIAPGTVITARNWQKYQSFMSNGMRSLFAGNSVWKFPAGFQIVIGPPSNYPPPPAYLNNTRKYSGQVRLKQLPGGAHELAGYVAGLPFPDPGNPDKGYKILADNWYRYVPYLYCGNQDHVYMKNSSNQTSGFRVTQVFRRLSHVSNPNQPINNPQAQGVDLSEFVMFLEPEQIRYTEILTLFYSDPERPEGDFLFIPKLRRVLRQSANSRCVAIQGTDFTSDDLTGFNGGIARFQADYLRDQPVLTIVNSQPTAFGNLANYYPDFFPSPRIGKFEARDTYVIDTRRIPSERQGYCYGKQIMYVDKYTFGVLWKDLYDDNMKLIKVMMANKIAGPVPHEGMQFFNGNAIETMWDLNQGHVSTFLTAAPGGGALSANQDCRNVDGVNYDDIGRYCTVGGLTQVMR